MNLKVISLTNEIGKHSYFYFILTLFINGNYISNEDHNVNKACLFEFILPAKHMFYIHDFKIYFPLTYILLLIYYYDFIWHEIYFIHSFRWLIF